MTKPNIMILQAEDTGRHHGCYGDAYAHTPNIDQLAAESSLFTNGITVGPVCAPSRCCMVTGMYPWAIGTHHMRSRLLDPPRIFTQELKDAGYDIHWPTKTDWNFDPPPGHGYEQVDRNWFEEGQLTVGDKPFLVYQNFGVTHECRVWKCCDGKELTPPHASRQQELPREHIHDPEAAPVPPYLPDTPEVRGEISRYYDNLAYQDMQVGRALQMLEDSGCADNTIVVYISDHGRGLCREKRWCYEAGIHIPLIVRLPEALQSGEAAPGVEDPQLVSWVDIAPTLLSLCGVAIPESYQGRVFLGNGVSTPERSYAVAARDRMGEAFDKVRACRSERYLYIRNDFPAIPYMQRLSYMENGETTFALRHGRHQGNLTEVQSAWMAETKPVEEFYDVIEDPHCVNNLAGNASLSPIIQNHRAHLDAELKRYGDLGEIPERSLEADGILDRLLDKRFKPQVNFLPYQFQIGKGKTVLTEEEAIDRYGAPE